MPKLQYETITYDEFAMIDAVKEYGEKLSISALAIAEKYGVPAGELSKEYAKECAKRARN